MTAIERCPGSTGRRLGTLIMLAVVFFDLEALEDLADGELEFGAGIEAGAGDHDDVGTGAGGVAGSRNEKRAMYQLSEAGVSVTYTVRLIKYSVLDLGE